MSCYCRAKLAGLYMTVAQLQHDLVSNVGFNSVEWSGCRRKQNTLIKKRFSNLLKFNIFYCIHNRCEVTINSGHVRDEPGLPVPEASLIWDFGCKYCLYVYHCICLDFDGPRNQGSFVHSQSIQKETKRIVRTQIKCDVENLKPGRNPVSYRKSHFCKRRVWMRVKVKNLREFKRYVSQNISSNFWNSTPSTLNFLIDKIAVVVKGPVIISAVQG